MLFSEFVLPSGLVVQNRVFKSAMSEAQGDKNGNPKPTLYHLYERWSQTGIGISVTGNVMVERAALGEPGNVILDDQSDLTTFEKWAKRAKRNHTKIVMQLNHPGKQMPKILGGESVAPSAIGFSGNLGKYFSVPKELTPAEIQAIITKSVQSAVLAKQTGFHGVQIHAAHGYLISQFLSPLHNMRTDEWGGSVANRSRFLLEIYRQMRSAVGKEFTIGVKLNSADFQKGGFTPEESVQVIEWLSAEGIDFVEISGGTYSSPAMQGAHQKESTKQREAYFLDFAKAIVGKVDVPLIVTGGWRDAEQMDESLKQDGIAMVGVARPFVIDPDFMVSLKRKTKKVYAEPKLKTGISFLDKQSALFNMVWYSYAMHEIGKQKAAPPPYISLFTFLKMLSRTGKQLFVHRQ